MVWKTLAKFCIWMYSREVPKPRRVKRRVQLDTELSRVWDPNNHNGWGNRELFTAGLSMWFKDRGDRASIDELVDYIHEDHVYLIRRKDLIRARKRPGGRAHF